MKPALTRSGLPILLALAAAPALEAQDWPLARQNNYRTGLSWGQGLPAGTGLEGPAVRARAYAGGLATTFTSLPGDLNQDGRGEVALALGGKVLLLDLKGRVLWDTLSLQAVELGGVADFDGDGSDELIVLGADGVVLLNTRDGSVVWKKTGWSTSENRTNVFNTKVADLNGDGRPELLVKPHWISTGTVYAYSFAAGFSPGSPDSNLLWSHPITCSKNGYFPVIGDLTNDGLPEVASACGSSVEVFNGKTGGNLWTISQTGNVYYGGRTEIRNIDADPQAELVLFTSTPDSTSRSVTVFDLLKKTTAPMVQLNFPPTDSLSVPNQTLGDVDGDGATELLLNHYDGTGWTAELYRYTETDSEGALTEQISLSNALWLGPFRPTATSAPLLLTRSSTAGRRDLEPFSTLTAYAASSSSGTLTVAESWRSGGINLLTTQDRGTPSFNSFHTIGIPAAQDLNTDGFQELYVSLDKDGDELADEVQALSLASGTPKVLVRSGLEFGFSYAFLYVGDGFSTPGAQNEAVVMDSLGSLHILSASLGDLASLKVGGAFPRYPQVLDGNGDGFNELLMVNSSSILLSLDAELQDQTGTLAPERWSYPGSAFQYAVTYDANQDGRLEYVVRNYRNPVDIALELRDDFGELVKRLEFETLPYNLAVANFVGDTTQDIAGMRQGLDGLYYNFVVDGSTFALVWEALAQYPESGKNLRPEDIALVPTDYTGDGLSDLFYSQGPYLCRMSGADGVWGGCTAAGSTNLYGGGLAVGRFDADAGHEFALFCPQQVMVVNPDLSLAWKVDRGQGESAAWSTISVQKDGAIGDTNEDGLDELFVSVRDGLYHFDADGATLWTVYLGGGIDGTQGSTSNRLGAVTLADTDGDGDFEVLVGGTDGFLYALDALTGNILWVREFFYQVGEPVVADADGDGGVDILVNVSDGYLYWLTASTLPAPAQVNDLAIAPDGSLGDPSSDADETEVVERLGAAWSAVPGAAGYVVAILSDRNTYVVDWLDVGNKTSVIIPDSRLVYGRTYSVLVQAYDAQRNGSVWARSDGVRIIDETPPSVLGLTARPNPFNPDYSGTELLASLSDPTALTAFQVQITDGQGGQVFFKRQIIASTSYALALPWSGLDSNGVRVPDGLFTVSLQVEDYGGHAVNAQTTVEVTSAEPTPVPTPTATPEPTPTLAPTPTALPGSTQTPGVTPTATPGVTPSSTPGGTPTGTPDGETPTPTAAPTPTPGTTSSPRPEPTATLAPATPTPAEPGVTPTLPSDPAGEPSETPSGDTGEGCGCTSSAPASGRAAGVYLVLGLLAVAGMRRRRA